MMRNHLSCHDILKDEYALILADLKLRLNFQKQNLMSYVKKKSDLLDKRYTGFPQILSYICKHRGDS